MTAILEAQTTYWKRQATLGVNTKSTDDVTFMPEININVHLKYIWSAQSVLFYPHPTQLLNKQLYLWPNTRISHQRYIKMGRFLNQNIRLACIHGNKIQRSGTRNTTEKINDGQWPRRLFTEPSRPAWQARDLNWHGSWRGQHVCHSEHFYDAPAIF